MKYRIDKGTETFAKLEALWKRVKKARRAARAVVDELGADQWVPQRGLAGGIMACEFKTPPEGWKRLSARHPKLYEPMAKNKALRERLAALPVVPYKDLNDIVGFKQVDHIDENTGVWRRISSPGLHPLKDCFLMDTGDAAVSKYTPPNGDIVEILESEYQRLADGGKKKRKAKPGLRK